MSGQVASNNDANALQRSDLNGFLFADIGVEGSGMTLSVISALARLGLDPWQEAGRLARLPRSAAVDGLARTISAIPASLWPLADAMPIATRLVALLPRRDGLAGAMALQYVKSPALDWGWLIVAVLAVALLASLAVRSQFAPEAAPPLPVAPYAAD